MNCAPTHNHILPYLTVPFICTSRLDGREILPDIGSEPTGVQGAEPPAGVWGILSGGQVIGDPKKFFFLSAARGGKL
jgi:hypothetical protein